MQRLAAAGAPLRLAFAPAVLDARLHHAEEAPDSVGLLGTVDGPDTNQALMMRIAAPDPIHVCS